jgi:hypothetical protein
MAKRKLTPKLKDYLYANRFKVKQSDYTGEALEYLLRLRRATKAAKTRKAKIAKVGKTTIPQDSELYEIIEKSAALKGQTVERFINENRKAIEKLKKDGKIVLSRSTDYAISDINKLPKRNKVYINGNPVSKGDAMYAIQELSSTSARVSNIVNVNYELSYDLTGDLYIEMPMPEQYEELLESFDDMSDEEQDESWEEFLKQFEDIVYMKS